MARKERIYHFGICRGRCPVLVTVSNVKPVLRKTGLFVIKNMVSEGICPFIAHSVGTENVEI